MCWTVSSSVHWTPWLETTSSYRHDSKRGNVRTMRISCHKPLSSYCCRPDSTFPLKIVLIGMLLHLCNVNRTSHKNTYASPFVGQNILFRHSFKLPIADSECLIRRFENGRITKRFGQLWPFLLCSKCSLTFYRFTQYSCLKPVFSPCLFTWQLCETVHSYGIYSCRSGDLFIFVKKSIFYTIINERQLCLHLDRIGSAPVISLVHIETERWL